MSTIEGNNQSDFFEIRFQESTPKLTQLNISDRELFKIYKYIHCIHRRKEQFVKSHRCDIK